MNNFYYRHNIFLYVIAAVLILCSAAAAGNYAPITSVDLGVEQLELEVGESYTFEVTYEPAEPSFYSLLWTVSDTSVISIDPASFTVTASAPGEAAILAESLDGVSFDICTVTVNGSGAKEAYELKAGSSFLSLSEAARAKITSRSIKRYLAFLENANHSDSTWHESLQRFFIVEARVTPGSEETEYQLALDCGMENAEMLEHLHIIILPGTLEQILQFTEDNPDLVAVFEKETLYVDDPIIEVTDEDLTAKTFNLGGNADTLSSFTTAHSLGYTGEGRVIAVIDSGINSAHEQFAGRVLAEYCAAHTDVHNGTGDDTLAVCPSEDSSAASLARDKSSFNHGSHVTGIAAGRDGVAPDAQIISILHSHERVWQCSANDAASYACPDYSTSGKCCRNTILNQSLDTAYEYILDLADAGVKIDALNMSYGYYNNSDSYCDDEDPYEYEIFNLMQEAGIVPVSSSGNDADENYYVNNTIGYSACLSSTFAVGALANNATPLLALYSNHSQQVDIVAPGTNIYSANFPSGYTTKQGTSMAAPMVTGSVALIKQAYPYNTPADMMNFLVKVTSKTVNKRVPGTSYTNYSYTKPVLSFSNFSSHLLSEPVLTISQEDVLGYSKGISISFPGDTKATGYSISVYDMTNKTSVTPTVDAPVHSGDTTTIKIHGNALVNGNIYRIRILKYHTLNGVKYKSNTVTVYGMPNEKVLRLTAQLGSKAVRLNSAVMSNIDGRRYYVYDANTNALVKTADVLDPDTVAVITGLKNGKLYYSIARSFRIYQNLYLFGPESYVVYFVPVSMPSDVSLYFSDETTAVISAKEQTSASGVKVLYREIGGALQNGCEAAENTCSVTGLSQSKAYEFYLMHYNIVNGKKHFGIGSTIRYNPPSLSGLSRPLNARIAVTSSTWTFRIDRTGDADGISVLYRINEGDFVQACEKNGDVCSTNKLSKDNTYTFYIMQYKLVNGEKVYSPGVTVKNTYGTKSVDGDGDELITDFVEVSESVDSDDLVNALEDYMTEEDLIQMEAMELLAPEMDYMYPEHIENDFHISESMGNEDLFAYPLENKEILLIEDDFETADTGFIDVETGDCPDEYGNTETKELGFPSSFSDLSFFYVGDSPQTTVPNFEH